MIIVSKTNLMTSGVISSNPGLLFDLSLKKASFSSVSVIGFSFKVGKFPERKLSNLLFDLGIEEANLGPTLTKYLLNCSAIFFFSVISTSLTIILLGRV